MANSTFQVVCPSDADINCAIRELRHRGVPPDMVRHVLFMHSVPDVYREAFFTAAHQLQAVGPDLRLEWLSSVSVWKNSRFDHGSGRDSKTSSDAQRSSLGSRDTDQSFTSATSASPSSFFFTNDGARESGGAQGFHVRATIQASDAMYNLSPLSPHFDGVPNTVPNEPHLITPAGQAFQPSGSLAIHTDHHHRFPEQHVAPQDVSTLKMDETISQIPEPGGKEKAASGEPAKWICPVCGTGCTRAGQMRKHIWNQCLNPIQYLCVGCRFRSHRFELVKKHCQGSSRCGTHGPQKIEVPARIKYASCLTGKLFNTAEELIDNADRRCRRSQDIQKSDQNLRLLALLGYGELNREIEWQCMSNTGSAKLWECCEWESEDAKQFSNIAEFGLQGARYLRTSEAPNNAIPVAGVGLEPYNLGIVDMRAFATRVLRKSNVGFCFEPDSSFTDLSDFSAAHSTASVPAETNPVDYNLEAQPTVHPQNDSPLPQRDSTGARMLDQGQAHMHANRAHSLPSGSPQSVAMLDFDNPLAQPAQYD